MVANAGICKYAVNVLESELSESILLTNRRYLILYGCKATAEDWDRIFSVNVRGTFFCYKHAGIQMVAQGRGGRIIGASSVLGKKGKSASTLKQHSTSSVTA